MKANYNEWFHKYNQYIETKNRGNVKGYNDTSWIDIMKRIKVLESAGNELYNQPLGVAGTERGFSHLLDLMAKSNYSFNDIDESLLKSYKHTLQASMSNMMVNSHAIVLHCTSEDKKYVSYDQMTRYYVVDVPFIQMHFGERDEFIRQKLQMMHTKSNGKFIDIQQFVSEEFDKILNFSLVVTVNGYFCNDCKIAIDEHGFKFKIAWTNSASDTGNEYLDIIIYKLDVLRTHHVQISTHYIKKNRHILISDLGIDGSQYKNNHVKCLIDFYSPEYLRGGRCNPIFGLMTDTHLLVHSYDGISDQFINTYPESARCFAIIYELENVFEIPNIFPATNYFDVLDDRRVYTERAEGVVDYNDFRVVSEAIVSSTKPPICTPPIIIDRDSTASFNTIIDCINLKTKLYKLEPELTRVGGNMSFDIYPPATIQTNYRDWITIPLTQVTQELEKYYATYLKGAILTSRVPKEYTSRFREVIDEMNSLAMDGVATNIPSHTAKCDVYNKYNWYSFVDYVSEPFERESMRVFLDIKTISQGRMNFYKDPANASFYDGISPHRFNRPISEQCFITLKWNLDRRVWLFSAPKINHFKGIGNSFYIDSGLTGNEIFKFFVQYTDTDNPVELETDPLTLEQVYDFDKFYEETSRHLGYIKYWNAENKLMKLSKILYGKYDDETVVQVLGRILSGSVSADEIINQYGSEIKYDDAGKSSLAYNKELGFSQYDPFTSDAAPFTINYLFYTMMMIHDNVDNIEALFMRMLVDKKYSNRYIDVNISDAIDTSITVPVNYSGFSKSPILIETASSNIPIGVSIYYGIPFVVNNRASSTPMAYRYTFNKYDNNIRYPLLLEDGFAPSGYLCWDRIEDFDSRRVVYSYDIQVGKLVSKYLTYAYTCISNIETNYAKIYDCRYLIDAFMTSYNLIRDELFDIRAQQRSTLQTDSLNVIELIVDNNEFLSRLDHIKECLTDIDKISYNNKLNSIRAMLDDLVKMIKKIYVQTGFDNEALRRIRNLYAYLCKYNNIMNIHELKAWWEHLDIEQIQHLVNVLAENPNFNESETTINAFYTVLNQYMHDKFSEIEDLDNLFYENTLDELNPTHFSPLSSYIKTVFNNYIFDLYAIDQIEFDKNPIYASRPYYVLISVNADNFKAPMDVMSGNYKLLCKADTIVNGNGWSIDDIVPLCEYACFADTPLSTLSAEIFDRSNNSLGTIDVDMTFMKAGSSVGSDGWLQMLPNVATTSIAFNNDHEDMKIVSGNVVSSIHSEMNFEMLYGNKYIQLDHDNAYVLDPVTYEEHVQEIVRVPNKMLNSLLIRENSNKANPRMFFKAGQVIHLPINETTNKLISVYGKSFVGQTLYLATDDGLSVFPVKVTAIDHTIARGFIEAEVDSVNAKWFETTDPDVIDKYLSTTVECHVLDDNMMNFVKEYNNSDYNSYYIPSNADNNGDTPESLPGDPIFVTNNEKYVYSRLNYFFHEDIPNRFIDDEKAAWKFIYLGEAIGKYGTVPPEPGPTPQIDTIKISLINKETTDITLPERYPILREEPDDHQVWDKEEKVFNEVVQNTLEPAKLQTTVTIAQLEYQRDMATDDNTRNHYQREIESMQRKLQRIEERIEKVNHYNEQKECPTTWYNVRSLEAALIYINNGRAITDPAIIIDKRDIPITDKLNVFLYDWKNKKWIDPATYTVRTNVVDMVIDNKADYITPDVMKEMIITSDGSWLYTDDILVYVAFNKSDIYDEITLNDNTCQVKFKPIISTAKQSILNPYGQICIRKHFDGHESYKFTEYNAQEHEFDGNGYYIKRVSQNGKYVGAPVMRICDMTLTSNGTTLNPDDLTVYIKMSFDSVSNVVNYASPQYGAQVYSAIDDFTPDETIRLICVNNNSQAQFNGAISTVMFEAVTSTDENERQIITITKSTLNSFIEGEYVCTVFRCNDYKSYGGLVLVNVSSNTEQIMTDNGRWVRIPTALSYYKELPDEFVVVPNDTETIDPSDVTINLDNVYQNSVQDEITVYNENDNPFEFYFNEDTHVRYPISNVTMNDPHSRFVVDVTNNPDVQVAKMTYIGISRYASLTIPSDGVIDVTGSIPTPLSRDRYEWWVNGRQIKGDDVVILSPTSFQLRNLRSLKNFELIELVDDIHDSEIMTQGNVYVDINGKTYGSYRLALLSNKAFVDQSIRYLFNTSNHTKFNDYTRSIDNNPNNNDIEDNILDQLTYDDSNITKYTQLYNKPSINGVTIYNMSSTDLGLSEIPVDKLIDMYDEVWKKEIITDPLFVTTHKEITASENHIVLHSKPATGLGYPDSIVVYASGISEKCFTLYVSKSHNGRITDLANTVKIIPLIRVGTYAIIEKEYSGMWLHCTESDVETIKI